MRPDHDGTLEAEIARLDDLGLDDLRKLCGRLVGAVPANHGTHLLRRRLAYELQAKVHGDLPTETQRRLKRLHEAFKADPGFTPTAGPWTEARHRADQDLAWCAASGPGDERWL